MSETPFDVLVIGGGVNGTGIARDAAGRGLSVLLCEKGDLAGATSSASTKLIHGGLRYLEYFDFRLVRESLLEREILLDLAPHIIWPLRFILPCKKGRRPSWMIAIGLWLYDRLGPRRRLPPSQRISLAGAIEGAPLGDDLSAGFAYSDCWVDDARLVALNALDARERGAIIQTRTACVSAARERGLWVAVLQNCLDGTESKVEARALVNAAGPWAGTFLNGVGGRDAGERLRLVRGSHIVVPRLYAGNHAYTFQNTDKRIVFALPYERDFTLIGTTEAPFEGDPDAVAISGDEAAYLCRAASAYFKAPVKPEQIIHSFSGVRPLYNDRAANASAITRDYVLDCAAPPGMAPILSVFGGKITTYRRLAERALSILAPSLTPPRPAPWTGSAPLPGGDIDAGDFERFQRTFHDENPWLPPTTARRLARAYGTRAAAVLGGAKSLADLGADFGAGLSQAEIDYLIDKEWARTAEDVLWRRSKLGLHMSAAQRARVEDYFSSLPGFPPRSIPPRSDPTKV
ncbi:glycerol-3-phosphate dehydrogenase [Methylocapsa palsarum]|uniref:Glycerol-3-phosphate dehydrogenase n=1 Tax=Methylocapsa palsarum TaxID=1612308 RepID=A0A1I3XH82_9HYPH|nr:glycerol-3-phosphate dehydrogenase [Methylocapsa palsarum]SFK18699.1 glycerol-3-phosphate dehydrogenase [Methylocapsa palsarum]